jgi:hypothetical protein
MKSIAPRGLKIFVKKTPVHQRTHSMIHKKMMVEIDLAIDLFEKRDGVFYSS